MNSDILLVTVAIADSLVAQIFLSLIFYLNVEFLVYWNQPIGDEYKKVFLSNFSIF